MKISKNKTLSVVMDGRYLILPIVKETRERVLRILLNGEEVTELSVPCGWRGESYSGCDFEAALNLSAYAGQTLELVGDLPSWFMDHIRVSDELPEAAANRPKIHMAPDMAWGNDPNGLIYHDGIYEFYYQYNPVNTRWMNMSWAHSRSRDMLHWQRSETVLLPTPRGTIYSGFGMENTPGFLGLPEKALLFFFTEARTNPYPWENDEDFTQNLAYSLDGGRTLIRPEEDVIFPAIHPLEQKPVAETRDPSFYWYEKGQFWYTVLYLGDFCSGIYKSTDLRNWEELQILDLREHDMRECADMFCLEDPDGQETWIFWCADGYYLMGSFDGRSFTYEGGKHRAYVDGLAYAAQCYRGLGKDVVTVPWLRTYNAGQNYRGMYGLPRKILLDRTHEEKPMRLTLPEPILQAMRPKKTWDALDGGSFTYGIGQEITDAWSMTVTAEEACDMTWTLRSMEESGGLSQPRIRFTYQAATGALLVDTWCPEPIRTNNGVRYDTRSRSFTLQMAPGIRDFRVICDCGILELTGDQDRYLAYLELPADQEPGQAVYEFAGDCRVELSDFVC